MLEDLKYTIREESVVMLILSWIVLFMKLTTARKLHETNPRVLIENICYFNQLTFNQNIAYPNFI